MLDKITAILRDYKEDDALVITADTAFEDLKLDSLDMAELVMNIEEELDVTIELDESLKTVGDLVKLIGV